MCAPPPPPPPPACVRACTQAQHAHAHVCTETRSASHPRIYTRARARARARTRTTTTTPSTTRHVYRSRSVTSGTHAEEITIFCRVSSSEQAFGIDVVVVVLGLRPQRRKTWKPRDPRRAIISRAGRPWNSLLTECASLSFTHQRTASQSCSRDPRRCQ